MAETKKNPINPALALVAAVAGWLVPGLGHVFSSNAADAFDMLGFLADIGSGIFYFLAGTINPAGGDVSRASGDYGTRLFATAGVLNLLCVLEVLQIGFGSKDEGHAAG
jgi:hypothetical protein